MDHLLTICSFFLCDTIDSLEVQLSGTNTFGLATGPDNQDSEGGVCAGVVELGLQVVPFGE